MPDPILRLNAALEGRYHIEREIGAGGMATVYLARDLKHDRQVAIKVLKPELAAIIGAERFLAEIRTTANLQHPHILPLFDSGEGDGFLYYVMPYVEGESLRERLDRETQLPVDEAVRLTTEVAEALDHAHSRGVIHRDIKPANLLLQEGRVLVADFGIALAITAAGGARLTETGLSIGTPFYMSPEQATGDREIDGRSDLYSLACITYEMLAGEPPHSGPTAQAVFAKILTNEPEPLKRRRATVPNNVASAVHKALSKLPADRFAGVDDFRGALSDLSFGRGDLADAGTGLSGRRGPALEYTGWAIAAAAVALWFLAPRGGPSPAADALLVEASIPLPNSAPLATGFARHLEISPDGETVVYVAQGPTTTLLYRRRLAESQVSPLPGTEDAVAVFFSPDGEWVGFLTKGGLVRKVPLDGGPIEEVGSGVLTINGAVWADGAIIVGHNDGNEARVFPEDGTASHTITFDQGPIGSLSRLPKAGWLLTRLGDLRLGAIEVATGVQYVLTEGGPKEWVAFENSGGLRGNSPRYVPGGYLAFVRHDGVLAVAPFDSESLTITGAAEPVLSGVRTEQYSGEAQWAVGSNGTLVYASGDFALSGRFSLMDDQGTVETLPFESRAYGTFALSPDGRRIATAAFPVAGTQDVWILDLETGAEVKLREGWIHNGLAWSPDSKSVLYHTRPAGQDRGTRGTVVRHDVRDRTTTQAMEFAVVPEHLTDDGRWLLGGRWGWVNPPPGIWIYDLETGQEIGADTSLTATTPRFSPDVEWIAWSRFQGNNYQVLVASFDEGVVGQPTILSEGFSPAWTADGSRLYWWLLSQQSVLYADRGPDGTWSVPRRIPMPLLIDVFGRDLEVGDDGRVLFVAADDQPTIDHLQVITNWVGGLSSVFSRGGSS